MDKGYLFFRELGLWVRLGDRDGYYVGMMEGFCQALGLDYDYRGEYEGDGTCLDLFEFVKIEESLWFGVSMNKSLEDLWVMHKKFCLRGIGELEEDEQRVLLWLMGMGVNDLVRGVRRVGDWRYVMGWGDMVKFGEGVYGFWKKVCEGDKLVCSLLPGGNIEVDMDALKASITADDLRAVYAKLSAEKPKVSPVNAEDLINELFPGETMNFNFGRYQKLSDIPAGKKVEEYSDEQEKQHKEFGLDLERKVMFPDKRTKEESGSIKEEDLQELLNDTFKIPEDDDEFPDHLKPVVLSEKDVLKKEQLPEQKIIKKAVVDTRKEKGKEKGSAKTKPVVKKVIKKKGGK